jgi:hypothetical protein
MQEQIKEIRVQLDGLAQLTKNLVTIYKIDRIYIPKGLSEDEYIDQIKKSGEPFIGKTLNGNSKEVNKTYDLLILAKAWLGKVLEELGSETPYANDGSRKEVKDIESAADKFPQKTIEGKPAFPDLYGGSSAHPTSKMWKDLSHIEKVDWLRQDIEKVSNRLQEKMGRTLNRLIQDIQTNTEIFNYNCWNAVNQSYNHLCEARFWLGFELGRIRDEQGK